MVRRRLLLAAMWIGVVGAAHGASLSRSDASAMSPSSSASVALDDEAQEIARGLASKEPEKVRKAAAELVALGREGAPFLAAALDDESNLVRLEALTGLAQIGTAAVAVLPRLVEHSQAIGATGAGTLTNAMLATAVTAGYLAGNPMQTMFATPGDEKDTHATEAARQTEACLTSLAIGFVAERDVPSLLRLVAPLPRGSAPNEFTGPRIGLLIALLRALDESPETAFAEFWPLVDSGLASDLPTERMTALLAASALGKSPKDSVAKPAAAVATFLESDDSVERALAAVALGLLKPSCEWIGPKLEPMLSDSSPYARLFAAVALREICGASSRANAVMVASLSEDDETCIAAAESLNGLKHKPGPDAVAPLIKRLGSKDERVLIAVARALGGCGEHAKSAVPKLKTLSKHRSGLVRRAAESALNSIR